MNQKPDTSVSPEDKSLWEKMRLTKKKNKENRRYRSYKGYACIHRYDEIRPNRGALKKEPSQKDIREMTKLRGGNTALLGRCDLINFGNRKCLFPNSDHTSCPLARKARRTKK